MLRPAPVAVSNEFRELRSRLGLSQARFADLLGVSADTYRSWDSGRRAAPAGLLAKARELTATNEPNRLWSLQELATQLGVHVRTLRHAVRSGRLEVTYGNRVVFRNPVPRATLAAGRAFLERYYKRSYSRYAPKPLPPAPTRVPSDCALRIRRLRCDLRLTQAQLAEQIGAAGKAVVFQWESGKRRPSTVFWERIEKLNEVTNDTPKSPPSLTARLHCRMNVRRMVKRRCLVGWDASHQIEWLPE